MSMGVHSLPNGGKRLWNVFASGASFATKSLKSEVLPIDGEMLLIRMPWVEYSAARCRVIISTAPLLAPYHVSPVVGSSVMQELMLMTLPDFFSRKCGMMTFVAWNMLLTLMSKTPMSEELAPNSHQTHLPYYRIQIPILSRCPFCDMSSPHY